ncbi:TPR repeat-containing protein (fragment) [Paraburkholderia ribeironis]|uniref:TPR repeat-containing protein n=1 Tax=Paraburkholderia ribeironis TaxID=1247936 RepID=A0A1N7SIH6_9BURK
MAVFLVWAGDPRPGQAGANVIDSRRSLRASAYLPLLRVPGIIFVSLQMGDTSRPEINELPPELQPLDLMGQVQDFADTAAIIECLDLVITVDTSVAHLAGALGKPVWILSRFDGCWRWLHNRDDSPWYPTARLFRQTQPGDWDDVIGRVTRALQLENEAGAPRS